MRNKTKYTLQRMRKSKVSYLFVAPYMILFTIFTVLPVVIAMFLSLTSFNVLQMPTFVGLENYGRLFLKDSVFMTGVKNTLILGVILGPGGYLLSLICAWFLNEPTPQIR